MELAFAAILYILIFSIGTICIIWRQYKCARDLKVVKVEEEVPVEDTVLPVLTGIIAYTITQSLVNKTAKDKEVEYETRGNREVIS